MTPLGRRLTPALLLSLIVIAFFWKLTLTSQYTWLASPDITNMVLPWYQFETREWHHLRFPLWDPYAWAGHPFLAQAQPGAAYPLNWILFLMPFHHGWISWVALNWYYVLTRIFAALAFYWLCRDLDRSRQASLIAGFTYGAAGYLASVEWPQMVNGAVWVPLVFLFQFRAARGERPVRNAILSGFFLGLAWLAGHHQMPLFVSLGSGFLWIFLTLRGGRVNVQLLRCASIAVLMAAAVSAFQTLPTAEYGRLARRWASYGEPLRWNEKVPYPVHADFSIKPLSIWNIVVPGTESNVNAFVGVVLFLFALIGLVRGWRDARVRWLASLALGGLLFALGPASVFHGVLYAAMPLIEKARVPAQALILFHLGMCALAAFGLDEFASMSRRAAAWCAAALAAFGGVLGFGGLYLFLTKVLSINGDSRFMVTAVAAILAAAILLAVSRGKLDVRAAGVLVLGLVVWENGNVSGYAWPHLDNKQRMAGLRSMEEDGDIRMFLAAQPGKPRVTYDENAIGYNVGAWWGIETFDVYEASAPALLWQREPFNPRTRGLLGIRYFIGTKPRSSDQTEVFRGASGHAIFEYAAWMPRVFAVHQAEKVSDAQATQMLTDTSVDLRTRTFSTIAPPPLEQCTGADTVRMASHMANTVTIEATMACRGLVILDDQYFPGWLATVDDVSAPIIDAYGLVRGVAVGAGKHTVEFQYRPLSVFAGAGLSLSGAAIALIAALRRSS